MSREQAKQSFILHLLSLVLAFALLWYSLNPAPKAVMTQKPETEPPDEKKRKAEPQSMPVTLPLAITPQRETAANLAPSPNIDEDDFQWPEFIDG